MHTGAQGLLVVRGEKEILIPMVEEFITEINLDSLFIKVKGDIFFV